MKLILLSFLLSLSSFAEVDNSYFQCKTIGNVEGSYHATFSIRGKVEKGNLKVNLVMSDRGGSWIDLVQVAGTQFKVNPIQVDKETFSFNIEGMYHRPIQVRTKIIDRIDQSVGTLVFPVYTDDPIQAFHCDFSRKLRQ